VKNYNIVYVIVFVALVFMIYSLWLHIDGDFENARYFLNWPVPMLLLVIIIEQRKKSRRRSRTQSSKEKGNEVDS
tara:strand:- start:133 stop:357 length:225 start_codon:yes stop_codon:yes gene_type:complete